ncbi:hypothetical protein GOQ29_11130 [Clostridium sp. D2Q-14]|uniref:hypothetical protein n=1 Tax=Anaeromonas gelatinilytica TaxID=2683194 RepID=UPI00193B64CD|nr:hypothetical protein [Anaeromonas gelatinilytica]MBS4536168.1 hypothetical protein [Anaeromonas gelatinilytica]
MIIVFLVATIIIIFLIYYYLLQKVIENRKRKSLYEFKKKNFMFFSFAFCILISLIFTIVPSFIDNFDFKFNLLKFFVILVVTSLIYMPIQLYMYNN